MRKEDKIFYLQEKHFSKFVKIKNEEENKLSDSQSMWCVCGKLSTGLHESNCRKFKDRVLTNVIKRFDFIKNEWYD